MQRQPKSATPGMERTAQRWTAPRRQLGHGRGEPSVSARPIGSVCVTILLARPRLSPPAPLVGEVEQPGGLALGLLAAAVVGRGGGRGGMPGELLSGAEVGPGAEQVADDAPAPVADRPRPPPPRP